MKENTAAVATTLERKLSHFRTIDLNRAVNVLCDRHFKALMCFPYGCMFTMGYVRVHARVYTRAYVRVRTV